MKYKIIAILMIMVLTSGLDNYRELNDLAIVAAIGIDKDDKGNYVVSTQILNSKKETSGTKGQDSSSKITVYESKAKTVQEALRNVIAESPKRLYIAHMKILMVSENIARDGITDCLDFFIRDSEANKEMVVFIVKEGSTCEEAIQVITPIETNPTKNIIDSLAACVKFQGNTVTSILSEAVSKIIEEGVDLTLASLKVEGDAKEGATKDNVSTPNPATKVYISDIAYFKGNKLKGFLEEDDNKMYNMFVGKIKNTVLEGKIESTEIALEIVNCKTKLTPKYERGEFLVDVNIDCVANIAEMNSEINIETADKIQDAEQQIALMITSKMQNFLYKTKFEYQSDMIGVCSLFRKYKTDEYKQYQDTFCEENFGKMKYNVQVKIDLESEGGLVRKW